MIGLVLSVLITALVLVGLALAPPVVLVIVSVLAVRLFVAGFAWMIYGQGTGSES